MKNIFTLLIASFISIGTYASGYTESFDNGIPDDWTIIDKNNDGKTFTVPGTALHDVTQFAGGQLANDYLVSPQMEITEQYHMLTFKHATVDYNYDYYEFEVLAVEKLPTDNNFDGAYTIMESDYVGGTKWEEATVDLSAHINKKLYIVFHIHNSYGAISSVCGIDEFTGLKKAASGPVETLTLTAPKFAATEVGTSQTAPLVISNSGINTVHITNITCQTPFSIQTGSYPIALEAGKSTSLQMQFSPESYGPFTSEIAVFVDNSPTADYTLEVTGETYTVDLLNETFENEQFPPLAWEISGTAYRSWTRSTYSDSPYQGEAAAYHSVTVETGDDLLITPAITVVAGDKLSFYAKNTSKKGTLVIKYSKDKKQWQDLANVDLTDTYKKYEYALPTDKEIKYLGFCAERSIYLDNIGGPHLSVPAIPDATAPLYPADKSTGSGLYQKVNLQWQKLYYADGYKVNMGTPENPTAILNQFDAGNNCELLVKNLAYDKKYIWQVIPYNNGSEAEDCPVWSFVTRKDPTINNFPYFTGFEKNNEDDGWGVTQWYAGNNPVHSGELCACTKNTDKGPSILSTPPVNLPENHCIWFYWISDIVTYSSNTKGNSDLAKTPKKQFSITYFEVSEDMGETWETLATLEGQDTYMKAYVLERVNLTKYGNKTIIMRWRYVSDNQQKTWEVGLDDVEIKPRPTTPIVEINNTQWDAGTLEFGQKAASEPNRFVLENIGVGNLEIESVQINNPDFTISIDASNFAVAEDEQYPFVVNYLPQDAGKDEATITITFKGIKDRVALQVKGRTRAKNKFFDNFESYEDFSLSAHPWIINDNDGLSTWGYEKYDYPHECDPLGFMVLNTMKTTPAFPTHLQALSGAKCLATMATYPVNGEATANDDWLIFPYAHLGENPELVINARSIKEKYIESFQVLISHTDTKPESFTVIAGNEGGITVPYKWAEYTFDLSKFANQEAFVAIRCVSKQMQMMLIDDVTLYDFTLLNEAPEFTTKPKETSVMAGHTFSYEFAFTDKENDEITTTVLDADWLKIEQKDDKYYLTGTPDHTHIGKNSVAIAITDERATVKQRFLLEVLENPAPVFTSEPSIMIDAGVTYRYAVEASDENNDKVTFTAELPEWLKMESTAAQTLITGTPTNDHTGENHVKIVASDGISSVEQSFTITVNATNGISDLENSMRIYPNPATDFIQVEMHCPIATVKLFTATGQLILVRNSVQATSIRIPTSALSPGVYVVQVQTADNNQTTSKIHIQ